MKFLHDHVKYILIEFSDYIYDVLFETQSNNKAEYIEVFKK